MIVAVIGCITTITASMLIILINFVSTAMNNTSIVLTLATAINAAP